MSTGRLKLLILGITIILLGVIVACGEEATPTATPTPTPTATPTATPTTAPTVAPTAGPGEPEIAPDFAEYWNPDTDFYGEPVYGGTLKVSYEDPLDHANVWGAPSGTSRNLRSLVHNNIVEEDPYEEGGIIPDLARGWTFDDDGLGITFFFHEGITWHNGEPFTCEDARFSLEVMATGEGEGQSLTAESGMAGSLEALDVAATECLDDLTLSLRMTAPSATMLFALTDREAPIFNKQWFLDGGEEAMANDMSVGTGAFTWDPGQNLGVDEQRFTKNPNYFKSAENGFGEGLPYVDNLVLFGILDESSQQLRLLDHQSDWHWVRNWGQYDAFVDHEQIMTVIRATRGHHSIWLNASTPPFDNVNVRQAIFMGIDRVAGIRVLQDGHGSAGFMMAPGSPWSLDEATGCAIPAWCPAADDAAMDARRAEAIAILEAENFDFDETYIFTVESDEQVVARATFVQEQLNLLGIKTEFDEVETTAYRELTQIAGTWGNILPRNDTMPADDPALGMGYYFRCASLLNHWTPQGACDETMESLLDTAEVTTDPVARKAASDAIQQYAMEQYWKFPLYWEQEAVAFWPEVRGYAHHAHPSGSFRRYEHMWIDEAHRADSDNSGQISGPPGGI